MLYLLYIFAVDRIKYLEEMYDYNCYLMINCPCSFDDPMDSQNL